jgi:uncharacterized protein YbaA (DUF1428 family)
MGYIDGFVIPVPEHKKDAYFALAAKAAPIFREFGATRVVECWGDDIPVGKTNDFRSAVIAEADEGVVFSWIEWPDKATRDAGMAKVMTDERMKPDGDLPFSGARLIYGGFAAVVDTTA